MTNYFKKLLKKDSTTGNSTYKRYLSKFKQEPLALWLYSNIIRVDRKTKKKSTVENYEALFSKLPKILGEIDISDSIRVWEAV
jgi:hypothetical protein